MEFTCAKLQSVIENLSTKFGRGIEETFNNLDGTVDIKFEGFGAIFKFTELTQDSLRLDVLYNNEVIFSTTDFNLPKHLPIYSYGNMQLYFNLDGMNKYDIAYYTYKNERVYLPRPWTELLVMKAWGRIISIVGFKDYCVHSDTCIGFNFNGHIYRIDIVPKEGFFNASVYIDNVLELCNTFDLASFDYDLTNLVLGSSTHKGDSELTGGDKFIDLPTSALTESIVPDNPKVEALVALVYDGVVAAYRFKTNVGYFDITRAKAREYGVSGFKVEKAIKLERCNGMLVTQSEMKNKRCVPDISGCKEDCEKLFNALFC